MLSDRVFTLALHESLTYFLTHKSGLFDRICYAHRFLPRDAMLARYMSSDGDRTVTRGNSFKLSVNYCRTNTRKKLFSERVVKVWNSLPPSIVNFSSVATFRNSLNKISLIIYTKC